jgi:tetratricopeptide (TPR) repeat protein
MALAERALARKDEPTAEAELRRALSFDGERSEPLLLLHRLYERRGAADQAIDALKRYVELEQQGFAPALKLVQLLAKRKDFADVRRYGELAYYVNPASVPLHERLAEAYLAAAPQRDLRRAVWHLQTALLAEPEDKRVRAALHVRLCRVHLLAGDKRRARQHLDQARAADPDLPALGELKQKL